jgi:hypothetical protein
MGDRGNGNRHAAYYFVNSAFRGGVHIGPSPLSLSLPPHE